ncbi:hypothetical protein F5J12DRAFT_726248, partial [Pisolithus orientalis]|uniref:uncharacterized protein n=1 Tax=Pisolithus orientalis TaxID=936130 RepID=UPI00222593F6
PLSATPDPASKSTSGTRLGSRKARTTLPALPSPGSSKTKKITTPDRPAMDWRAHLASQSSDCGEMYWKALIQTNEGGYSLWIFGCTRCDKCCVCYDPLVFAV